MIQFNDSTIDFLLSLNPDSLSDGEINLVYAVLLEGYPSYAPTPKTARGRAVVARLFLSLLRKSLPQQISG